MMAPFYIGLRFARSRRGNTFLSLITWVSVIGLALGVAALIVVASVMNGFETELKRRILGSVPHLVVGGLPPDQLLELGNVVAVSRFASQSALLVNKSESRLVAIYGIDPNLEDRMSIIPNHMVFGSIKELGSRRRGIVLGASLASRLGITPDGDITIIFPFLDKHNTLEAKVIHTKLVGTFKLDSELDYSLALINIDFFDQITNNSLLSYRLRLNDAFEAPSITQQLARNDLEVKDWTWEHGDFFRAVKMEKIMMFVLLLLVVVIAGFTIVSSLSMAVKEKKYDIAILRSCGLSTCNVTVIFMVHGALIGVFGVLLGTIAGLPLAYNITGVVSALESILGGSLLAGTYFDSIPSDLRLNDILIIISASLAISITATVYPAYRAASLNPAEILRCA